MAHSVRRTSGPGSSGNQARELIGRIKEFEKKGRVFSALFLLKCEHFWREDEEETECIHEHAAEDEGKAAVFGCHSCGL